MIGRILIAVVTVIACFYMPSVVDSEFTELASLRENSILSAIVIVLMIMFVRGWTGVAIGIIEAFLIAVNLHIAYTWEMRSSVYLAINYTTLHQAAFAIELAIISARIITGLRQIGADIDNYRYRNSAHNRTGSNSERHQ